MKETFYFSHDYNARDDEKIVKMLVKEDWYGYGLFWAIVEKLYENDGVLEYDIERLAFSLRTQSERIKKIVENYGLFIVNADGTFTNRSVIERLNKRKTKSEKARKSALTKWKRHYANAERTQSERYAIKESKGKESKINNNPPTPLVGGEGEKQKNSGDEVVQKILQTFRDLNDVPRLRDTADKRKKISARLKTFSPEEITTAISNRSKNPYMRGENESHTVYRKDFNSLFRNDEQMEKWLERKQVSSMDLLFNKNQNA